MQKTRKREKEKERREKHIDRRGGNLQRHQKSQVREDIGNVPNEFVVTQVSTKTKELKIFTLYVRVQRAFR